MSSGKSECGSYSCVVEMLIFSPSQDFGTIWNSPLHLVATCADLSQVVCRHYTIRKAVIMPTSSRNGMSIISKTPLPLRDIASVFPPWSTSAIVSTVGSTLVLDTGEGGSIGGTLNIF